MITSDKCYENQERSAGYSEHEPMGGHDPYSASKGPQSLLSKLSLDPFSSPRRNQ